jgi:6-phosphofructokinase 2
MVPGTATIATVTLNPSLDEWVQLDTLQPGGLNRASAFARYAGGKGINVSRVIQELGGSTIAFAPVGGDDGAILQHLLRAMSLRHETVPVKGTTRNNYKIQTRHPRALTEINLSGPAVSRTALQALERRFLRHIRRLRCAAFCGSLPPGAPPNIYRRWIEALRRRGVPSVLDTSGEALRHGLRTCPWMIKPNRQEAEGLLQRRLTTRASRIRAVQQLLRYGAEIVVLSLGAEGALLGRRTMTEIWWARPPLVRVRSAVGAGDALVGGFLYQWTRRPHMIEAFRFGVACGTASAMTPGTELCHRRDVYRLLPRVRLQRVD